VVVAKTERAREGLKALFAKHDVEREYVAIVVGEAKDATYATLHARHPTDRLRFTSRCDSGRRAVTHVRVIERLKGTAVVACTLETGRTHQIRVHLTEQARTPILGDALYGKRSLTGVLERANEAIGRQALHARVLGFEHPISRRPMRWESAPPPDFAACLACLRGVA
jgi:23S rRNA pseudouridine1911/1915/1917 synthase